MDFIFEYDWNDVYDDMDAINDLIFDTVHRILFTISSSYGLAA